MFSGPTSWSGVCQPIFPAWRDPSLWLSKCLEYQPLLPVLDHQQTCLRYPIASRAFFPFLLWQGFYLSFSSVFQNPESYRSCCSESDGFEPPGARGSFVHKNLVAILLLVRCCSAEVHRSGHWEGTVHSLCTAGKLAALVTRAGSRWSPDQAPGSRSCVGCPSEAFAGCRGCFGVPLCCADTP